MMSFCRMFVATFAIFWAGGCSRLTDDPASDVLGRSRVRVSPTVLETYVGIYRLPSGAHFPVVRDGDRLLGGTPLHELLPQTTREFGSNRLPGQLYFERNVASAMTLRYRLAKRDHVCARIDLKENPDPTRQVSAGGHKLRMLVAGEGSPTIVLEDGIGNGIDLQSDLHAGLSALSTTVAYDHAGTGGSEPGPDPRSASQIARELRLALESAGLPPLYLLIGGSIGAEYIRIFACEFPKDTAGLMLLDPTPDWDALSKWAATHAPARADMYREFARRGGVMMDRLMSVQEPGRAAEWAALESTRTAARRAIPRADIPIVQITGAGGRQTNLGVHDKILFFDAWLKDHLPQAKHVLATHSGHAVAVTDRRLVLDEVRQLLQILRHSPAQPQ